MRYRWLAALLDVWERSDGTARVMGGMLAVLFATFIGIVAVIGAEGIGPVWHAIQKAAAP